MRFLSLALLSGLLACSTSDPPRSSPPSVGPTSGVDAGDPDARKPRFLDQLTLDERKRLCDWTADIGGGYGKVTLCDGGLVVSNMKDQSTCIGSYLSSCTTATVTEWEECRRKEVSDPCALLLYTAAECKEIRRCIGRTDGGPPPAPRDGG